MMDWARALSVFILGFGGVFAALWILTISIRATGYITKRLVGDKENS